MICLLIIHTSPTAHNCNHLKESLMLGKKKKNEERKKERNTTRVTLCLRIFGFPSHSQTTCLHVRKDILHDLSKVCCTQWIVAEIVTIAPCRRREPTWDYDETITVWEQIARLLQGYPLTCIHHTPLALGGKSLGALLGDCVSSWMHTSVEYGLTTWNSDHWKWCIRKRHLVRQYPRLRCIISC